MQISKECIFSGLNNLNVNNIFSTNSDEMFGFTNDEVKKLAQIMDILRNTKKQENGTMDTSLETQKCTIRGVS